MNTQELLDSMVAVNGDNGGVYFDDHDGYIDWSSRTARGRSVEVGDGANAVVLDLSRADMVRLQRALTLMLLQDAG